MRAPAVDHEADEEIVFRTRLHPMVLGSTLGFAAFVVGVVVLIVARNELPPPAVARLWAAGGVVILLALAPPLARWWTSEFAVTRRRTPTSTSARAAGRARAGSPAPLCAAQRRATARGAAPFRATMSTTTPTTKAAKVLPSTMGWRRVRDDFLVRLVVDRGGSHATRPPHRPLAPHGPSGRVSATRRPKARTTCASPSGRARGRCPQVALEHALAERKRFGFGEAALK